MRALAMALAATLLMLAAGSAQAQQWDDDWSAENLTGDVVGTTTGFSQDGQFWFPYLDTDYPVPGTDWWNAWFYNGPLIIPSGKTIIITVDTMVTVDGMIEICINYSDDQYDDPTVPPLPGSPSEFLIVRDGYAEIFDGMVPYTSPPYEVLYYNPSWVSVDIRLDPGESVSGTIYHECHGASPVEAKTWSVIKSLYR